MAKGSKFCLPVKQQSAQDRVSARRAENKIKNKAQRDREAVPRRARSREPESSEE